MDYTRSKDHVVHTGTGNRMHDDTQPNTTVLSANDVNQVNWSLMEVIKAAGLEGKTFNPDDASSYHVLQNALKAQFAPIGSEPDVMTGATESSGGTSGLVPAPIAGDENKVLSGDGKWKHVSGVPIGTVEYFATTTPPAGYLKADGAAVGRETYPELFTAIGTTFGAGDGSTTFNLPDLRGEFIRGWDDGRNLDAGRGFGSFQEDAIRKITGYFGAHSTISANGVFSRKSTGASENVGTGGGTSQNSVYFDSSSVVPTANENRPRNIALLACIKAFDAATNPGLIDITELANEMAGKVDRVIDSKPVRYVIDAYRDGTNWYRKWSDGWLEQGGRVTATSGTAVLIMPYENQNYFVTIIQTSTLNDQSNSYANRVRNLTTTSYGYYINSAPGLWYACGQGAQS